MLQPLFQIESFGISDTGLVREHNEDVWSSDPENGLFILADGMGGHAAGEVAAREAVDSLSHLVDQWKPTQKIAPDESVAVLRDLLCQVNEIIYRRGRSDESLYGMGTTLCVLLFIDEYVVLGHVGDSRIYRLRDRELEQLTEDHSLAAELVALGALSTVDADLFPNKHILTRAIGTHAVVEPSVNFSQIDASDLFMICSDGLTNYVSDQKIADILLSQTSLKAKGEALVEQAIENGGGDNVTLILLRVKKVSR